MAGSKAVTGVFEYIDDVLSAAKTMREKALEHKVYSPALNHEIIHEVSPERSAVRFFTGLGGVTGLTAGFALAIWTSLDYPMRTSAKDIVSVPGFVVCGYEWTILYGGLMTLLGLLVLCGIPNVLRKVGYHPRFSDDRFGVVVDCDAAQVDEIKSIFEKAGAEEVVVSEGL